MAEAAALKNQKQITITDGGNAPVESIADMGNALQLSKLKNQVKYLAGSNEEYIIAPAWRGVTAMAEATVMKSKNNLPQKYDEDAPQGGVAAMTITTVPEIKNNKLESIIKLTKGKVSIQMNILPQLQQLRH